LQHVDVVVRERQRQLLQPPLPLAIVDIQPWHRKPVLRERELSARNNKRTVKSINKKPVETRTQRERQVTHILNSSLLLSNAERKGTLYVIVAGLAKLGSRE
jgi:hypothetical protein